MGISPKSRSRRALLAGAALCTVTLAACGQVHAGGASPPAALAAQPGGPAEQASSPGPKAGAGKAKPPTMVRRDPLAHLGPETSGGSLTATIQLRPDLTLTPIPKAGGRPYAAAASRAGALRTYQVQGELPATAADHPAVFLALLTDTTMGTATADGHVKLLYVRTPVWVIAYHEVRDGIGAGSGGGNSQPGTSAQPLVNLVAFVSAATGKFLFETDDTIVQATTK